MPDLHEVTIGTRVLFPDEVNSSQLHQLEIPKALLNMGDRLKATLLNAFEHGDDAEYKKAENVARVLGGMLGSYVGSDEFMLYPPFVFGRGTLAFDDHMIDISGVNDVLDHGIGANGLVSHMGQHLRNPNHRVIASALDDAQAFGLEGMAKILGFPKDSFMAFPDAEETGEIVKERLGEGSIDLLLMSRIHSMDPKIMRKVTALAPSLLKAGGVIIVRGPQEYKRGTSSPDQVEQLTQDPTLTVSDTFSFQYNAPHDQTPQQTFILRRA